MITILFMPTMKCNLKCEYCHFQFEKSGFYGYDKFHPVGEELRWWEWLQYLNRFRPYLLEFTGGEPLLYKDFKDLVAHIPYDSQWAITSNSLLNINNISVGRCISWTASYHGFNLEKFEANIDALKRADTPVSVSVVASFKNLDKSLENALRFKLMGYRVNILRELNPGVNWEGSEEWQRLIELRHKGFNVVEEDIPAQYEFSQGWNCLAGSKYFGVMPDGRVFKCYSGIMNDISAGHIKDFTPVKMPEKCQMTCYACALDYKFRLSKINEEQKIAV